MSIDTDRQLEPELDVPKELVDHPRYKIVGRLGEGGMGIVYKAEHRVMGRTVALKVISREMTNSNPDAINRFRREVRLASRLSHPNIVVAYDADEADGLHFLVMEYVDGSSLDRVIRDRGPLAIPAACSMIQQAATGLQHAHERGMIHRDIKPHNLMVTHTGEVKILDFGLARVAAGDGQDLASPTAMVITKPQAVMGTPDFMSPEQARNYEGLDVRSDLYSLGCTLYYLVTGKPPFECVGAYAKMIAHFKEPAPDLNSLRPDASPELARVVQKMMAKSPGERYQTPSDFAAALQPFVQGGSKFHGHQAHLHSREKWLEDPEASGSQETRPSYASEPALEPLPQASRISAGIANAPQSRHSKVLLTEDEEAKNHEAELIRKRWVRVIPLAIVVLLGITGMFALAKRMSTGEGGRHAQTTGVAKQDEAETFPDLPPIVLVPEGHSAPPPEESMPQSRPVLTLPAPIAQATPAPPNRKKQVLLLVPSEFAHGELLSIRESFKAHDVNVISAGWEKKLDGIRHVKGEKVFAGYFAPENTFKDITPGILDSIDAVIVMPGEVRTFTSPLLAGPDFKGIVDEAIQKRKVIGAIGAGEVILGVHGYLEHSEASTVQARIPAATPIKVKAWKDDPKVVVDLPFVTLGELGHTRDYVEAVLKAIPLLRSEK